MHGIFQKNVAAGTVFTWGQGSGAGRNHLLVRYLRLNSKGRAARARKRVVPLHTCLCRGAPGRNHLTQNMGGGGKDLARWSCAVTAPLVLDRAALYRPGRGSIGFQFRAESSRRVKLECCEPESRCSAQDLSESYAPSASQRKAQRRAERAERAERARHASERAHTNTPHKIPSSPTRTSPRPHRCAACAAHTAAALNAHRAARCARSTAFTHGIGKGTWARLGPMRCGSDWGSPQREPRALRASPHRARPQTKRRARSGRMGARRKRDAQAGSRGARRKACTRHGVEKSGWSGLKNSDLDECVDQSRPNLQKVV